MLHAHLRIIIHSQDIDICLTYEPFRFPLGIVYIQRFDISRTSQYSGQSCNCNTSYIIEASRVTLQCQLQRYCNKVAALQTIPFRTIGTNNENKILRHVGPSRDEAKKSE